MNTAVIIMADGLSSRWEEECKHLLPVNGIPLIARTVKQIKSCNLDNITLICPDSFRNIPELDKISTMSNGYKPLEDRPLLDGILRTQMLWSDRTIILLGDVCFSNKAIKLLVDSGMDYFLLGRKGRNKVTGKQAGELFALSFMDHNQEDLVDCLQDVLYSGEKKLWGLYKYYPITIYETCDYTDDIDSVQAYTQFWDKLHKAAIEDDEDKDE